MSTFGGVVLEFPDVRGIFFILPCIQEISSYAKPCVVDYFRHIPGRRPPLACFLSHIHSDHLTGLDTLKSPL